MGVVNDNHQITIIRGIWNNDLGNEYNNPKNDQIPGLDLVLRREIHFLVDFYNVDNFYDFLMPIVYTKLRLIRDLHHKETTGSLGSKFLPFIWKLSFYMRQKHLLTEDFFPYKAAWTS